jgi:hypothetical protein
MEKVMQVRHKEMTTLWRFGILGALQGVLWHSTTAFVALAIFGTYTYLGNRCPVYLLYCCKSTNTDAATSYVGHPCIPASVRGLKLLVYEAFSY